MNKVIVNNVESEKKRFIEFVIVVLCLVVLTIAWSILLIGYGVTNINDCPSQPKLPVWMIVTGSIQCFSIFLFCLNPKHECSFIVIYSVRSFIFIWFIYGNVVIFTCKDCQSTITNQSNVLIGCKQSEVYVTSFATVITEFVILCIICLFSIVYKYEKNNDLNINVYRITDV